MMDIDKPNQDEVSEKQETPSPLDMFNIDTHSPIAAIPVSNNTDVLKDARYLFRTLMTFCFDFFHHQIKTIDNKQNN